MKERKISVLDTFSGAGGFSLGFQMAGFEVIGAIEIDKWACETFSYNHPNVPAIQRDITTISDKEILELFGFQKPDIIIGGPPCQGFSIANKNAGDIKDPRNSLFKEFLRMGVLLEPSIMIMENVPNLIKAKNNEGKFVIDIIKDSLESLGFKVYIKILDATNYGVPQIRNRLFVIASKYDLDSPFPEPTFSLSGDVLPRCPTLWEAISDLPVLEACQGAEILPYGDSANNDYQRFLRANSTMIYNHKAMNHTKRMVERFASMKNGDSINDVPEHLKPRKRNSEELVTKAYDQNNRRMHADKPCHTIAASFYANFVHPYQHRNFTAREGARIQSFPDWYRFMGKPTVVSHKLLAREERNEEKHLCQYNQIGNAVPPLLAKAIALNIKNQIQEVNNVCSWKQSKTKTESHAEIF
ncbi:TPA: DNA cytosine methyltransferase [Legionella pneumophila]